MRYAHSRAPAELPRISRTSSGGARKARSMSPLAATAPAAPNLAPLSLDHPARFVLVTLLEHCL
jgi:hypothetical protein